MRPIAVIQHEPDVAPGYFETWLRQRGFPFELIRVDRGERVPADAAAYSGVCLMGGTMSVNDPLDWIDDELALIRAADAARVPVIGHCLGGQLLAKAFGAPVRRNRVKEIGWGTLEVTDRQLARAWLGEMPAQFEIFQWHGDTFALPPGARNFLASAFCANQAFVVERDGYAHLGMQFHCEMTPALVQSWATRGGEEIAEERRVTGGPGVQDVATMLDQVQSRTKRINAVARRLYERWAAALAGVTAST
jgi:GMP synthase-like glutamine amidotransferase